MSEANKRLIGKKTSLSTSTYNCRSKEAYSLNGQLQIGEVVYKGIFSNKQPSYKEKKYVGIAEESLKGRLYNLNLSFRNGFYKNGTDLSKELWQIKIKYYTPEIYWIIIRKCLSYNYNNRK